ncbi:MAG: glycosyltransferase family 2 protein [Pseudomonadota bacterium]
MGQTVDVSVIIPAYKAEKYLPFAIRSALAQTGVTLEVIIADDASPTPMAPVVTEAAAGDARVRFVRLDENKGPSGARNAALDLATGRFVAVLDSDDEFRPGRLEQMVAAAETLSADIIVDNLILEAVDADMGQEPDHLVETNALSLPMRIELATYIDPREENATGRHMGYMKPLFRREKMIELDVRYDESLRNSEDYYLVAELLAQGATMFFCDIAGYVYKIHGGSISQRLSVEQAKAIVDKQARFQTRFSDLMTGDVGLACSLRSRAFTNQYVNEAIIEKLKAKDVFGVGELLIKNPASIGAVARKFAGIAHRKITGAAESRFG